MKLLKTVFINIFILLVLLIGLNLLITLSYQIRDNTRDDKGYYGMCASLPNYKDLSWASTHFREFDQLRSNYKSYYGWRRLPFQGQTISIDKNGIRETVQFKESTKDSMLVVFMGGSTMWGLGSENNQTIPSVFADLSKGKYQSLNFGESGYRAFQSFLHLNQKINEGLKPNVIISYDGVNEEIGFRSELESTSHSREQQINSLLKGQETKTPLGKFFLEPMKALSLGPLWELSQTLKRKLGIEGSDSSSYHDLSQERTNAVASYLLDSWMSSKVLAERNGAYFLAVLQPNAAMGHPELNHLSLDKNMLKPFHLLYPAVIKMLESPKYQELSGHFLDLSDAFDKEEYIYIDYNHVSPNGNRIIAERIYDYLDKVDSLKNINQNYEHSE